MSGLHHNHICGCYYVAGYQRHYLPQVSLDSHTTINPITFSTQLKQTFSNSSAVNLPKVRYCFPLYDGVAVSGYTVQYAGKTLRGIVKQKDEAKKTYQAAVDRGDTASLLEALPAGVFGLTLGNIPTGQDITVTISYCGELKHDSQIDGLRFLLPTSIAPRYGSYPGTLLQSNVNTDQGVRITVNIDMLGSAIRKVQSPSHILAVSMGELSRAEKNLGTAPFCNSQASTMLALGSAELADDFVLQLLVDDIGNPKAVIEKHPDLPNHRAIMATLVPKFTMERPNPEIVFIADQSGSMQGETNKALVASLTIFLKSLPLGVRFNVCAFGDRFQFLWPKSVPYSEDSLNTAIGFVETFSANFGGTELLEPIRQTFERQLKDLSLEVMLLTDGQIWGENMVFDYINQQIREKQVDARVFALGIGEGVSHTLVEGVARAGNGFAQFTQTGEEIDQKVIRMLKGALYAHTRDYTLEVHYEGSDAASNESDFEIIEKVDDYFHLVEEPGKEDNKPAKPKSFFDTSADLNFDTKTSGRYTHLPELQIPAVVQGPSIIPPLFPFNRTSVYLLLGPDTPQKMVSSVTLRATSSEGPLELNIPVHATGSGATIHQLAARKAIQDLEEGRGWLQSATVKDSADGGAIPVKTKYESRFDEIVEREAVRLGETFCVAAKHTSFVAVSNDATMGIEEPSPSAASFPNVGFTTSMKRGSRARLTDSFEDEAMDLGEAKKGVFRRRMAASSGFMPPASMPAPPSSMHGGSALMMTGGSPGGLMQQNSGSPFAARKSAPSSHGAFGTSFSLNPPTAALEFADQPFGLFDNTPTPVSRGARAAAPVDQYEGVITHRLIALQSFAGGWVWEDNLLRIIGKDGAQSDIAKLGNDRDVAATALVIAFMELRLHKKKGVWELVVAKARKWLGERMGGDEEKMEELIRTAAEDF